MAIHDRLQFDEGDGTFFCFLLTLTALTIIPLTVHFLWSKFSKNTKSKEWCECRPCRRKTNLQSPLQRLQTIVYSLLLILGWILLLDCTYRVVNLKDEYKNPFEILQIHPSSSREEILRGYRKIRLTYCIEKTPENRKTCEGITEAYKIVMDDGTRNNWVMYGNPKGPKAPAGFALPAGLMSKEAFPWVSGLYFLCMAVLLPLAVCELGRNRFPKCLENRVLNDTVRLYQGHLRKDSRFKNMEGVIRIISASFEFEDDLSNELPAFAKLEMLTLIRFDGLIPIPTYNNKAKALIHAHLNRQKISSALKKVQLGMVVKYPYLLREYVNVCADQLLSSSGRNSSPEPTLDRLEDAMKLSAMVVQALWKDASPLLQLPYVTQDVVEYFEDIGIYRIKDVTRGLQDQNLRGMFQDEQYNDFKKCLSRMPFLELQVENSWMITEGSEVILIISFTRKSLECVMNTCEDRRDEELDQNVGDLIGDDDVDESEWLEKQMQYFALRKRLAKTLEKSHGVHCPFYPEDKQEHWWVYVTDSKHRKLVTFPYLITNLVEQEKMAVRFTAPPKPGFYKYSLIVRSDSYLDCEFIKMFTLDVAPGTKICFNYEE